MKKLFLFTAVLLAISGTPAFAKPEVHAKGPNGLEGWRLFSVYDDRGDKAPDTLVIARNGKIIRRVKGDPFVWKWMFVNNGKQIAMESGPLHFGLACVLMDLQNGKELERLDCFHYPDESPSSGWPNWIYSLEGKKVKLH